MRRLLNIFGRFDRNVVSYFASRLQFDSSSINGVKERLRKFWYSVGICYPILAACYAGFVLLKFKFAPPEGDGVLDSVCRLVVSSPLAFVVAFAAFFIVFLLLIIMADRMCTYISKCYVRRNKECDSAHNVDSMHGTMHTKRLFIVCTSILLVCYVPWLVSSYPGLLDEDTFLQFTQFLGLITPSDHHPYFDTLIYGAFYYAGDVIVGSCRAGVFFYCTVQMVVLCIELGFAFLFLYRKGASFRFLVVSAVVIGLAPICSFNASRMVKDMTWMVFFIPFILMYLQTCLTKGEYLRGGVRPRFVIFALLAIFSALTKKTGLYIAVILIVLLVLFCSRSVRKKLLAVLLAVVVAFGAWSVFICSSLGVAKGYSHEALSLPIQQVARASINGGDSLSAEEQSLLDKYFPNTDLATRYNPTYADPVKDVFDVDAYAADSLGFWKLYVMLGLDRPKDYIAAFLSAEVRLYGYFSDYQVAIETSNDEWRHEHFIEVFPNTVSRRNCEPTEAYSQAEFRSILAKFAQNDDIWASIRQSTCQFLQKVFPLNFLFSTCAPLWIVLFAIAFAFRHRNARRILLLLLAPWLLVVLTVVVGPCIFPRYLLFPFYTMFLLVCLPAVALSSVTSVQCKVVLFFSPHQDDELLTLGAYAQHVMSQGADAHVILCSNGVKSYVRQMLDDGQSCNKCEGSHEYCLDEAAFSDARDREYLASCQATGYRPSRIHFASRRVVDGSLSKKEASAIIRRYLAVFPEAEVCTISPFVGEVQHSDHRHLGQAAVELYRKGRIRRLNLFVEPYCLQAFRLKNPDIELSSVVADGSKKAGLASAIAQYCFWDPSVERYAIGYHSVTGEFDAFMKEPASYWHAVQWRW